MRNRSVTAERRAAALGESEGFGPRRTGALRSALRARDFAGVALDATNGFCHLFHAGARPQQHVLGKPDSFLAELIVLRTVIAFRPILQDLTRIKILIMAR